MIWKFGPVRDVVLLVSGLGLLGHETLIVPEPRGLLITVAAAMIGLPATFLADRKFVGSTVVTPEPPANPPGPPPALNGSEPPP